MPAGLAPTVRPAWDTTDARPFLADAVATSNQKRSFILVQLQTAFLP